jgi:hypothetical protein
MKRLMPAAGDCLVLQPRSFVHFDEDGGHCSVYASNDHTKGWAPLGFWTVYRKDGVGTGADADGKADMGWQL